MLLIAGGAVAGEQAEDPCADEDEQRALGGELDGVMVPHGAHDGEGQGGGEGDAADAGVEHGHL